MIRRIDPIGRIAYGVLCIDAMAALAFPLLVVIGPIAGAVLAIEGDASKGLAVWLLSWACAVFTAGLFLAIFFTMWPLASDWVTEWGGYALGFAIASVGLAIMALLVAVLMGFGICTLVLRADWGASAGVLEQSPAVAEIGEALLTRYLVPFEVASVLLLVVMIGAAYLSRPEE